MTCHAPIAGSFVAALGIAVGDLAAAAEPVRHTTQETSRGGTVVVAAEIAAPRSVVLAVLIDVEARVADVRDLRRVELYVDGADAFAAEFDLAILGMDHQFHILYDVDRSTGVLRFTLDPTLRNDIDVMNGSYVLQETSDGTRLTYTCTIDAGYPVPKFLRRRLVTDRAVQEIEGIRDRAEAVE